MSNNLKSAIAAPLGVVGFAGIIWLLVNMPGVLLGIVVIAMALAMSFCFFRFEIFKD